MAHVLKDPLLSGTRGLLRIVSAACFVLAVLTLVIGVIGLTGGINTSQFAHHPPETDGAKAALIVSTAPLLALYGWFLRLLREIVDTVAVDTPFTADNADRLRKMGWIAVALTLVSEAITMLSNADVTPFRDFGLRIDGPGLLVILVLFILARVFRKGAAMHEDLEGTV